MNPKKIYGQCFQAPAQAKKYKERRSRNTFLVSFKVERSKVVAPGSVDTRIFF